MKILIATHNKHKLSEMSRILEPMGYEVVTDTDLGFTLTEAEENGTTFLENARIKAESGCKEFYLNGVKLDQPYVAEKDMKDENEVVVIM